MELLLPMTKEIPTTMRSGYTGFKTLTYDLSAYANMDFTVAWEGCMKYYEGYNGYDGDQIFIDDISLIETSWAVHLQVHQLLL